MAEKEVAFVPDFGSGATETLLRYTVSAKDVENYENLYLQQLGNENVDLDIKFQYAWCLVHGLLPQTKRSIPLLEELFQEGNERMKRDSLFYLAVAHAKLKNYATAKKHVSAFLSVEPTNLQAQQLDAYISAHIKRDGLVGMAIVGGAAVLGGAAAIAIGGFVLVSGAGMAIARAVRGKKASKTENADTHSDIK